MNINTASRPSPAAAILALVAVMALLVSPAAFASRYPPCSGQQCQIDPHLPCSCPNNSSITTDCQNFFNDCYQGIPPQPSAVGDELSEEGFLAELASETVGESSPETEPAAAP